jgi:hypothetical protein
VTESDAKALTDLRDHTQAEADENEAMLSALEDTFYK